MTLTERLEEIFEGRAKRANTSVDEAKKQYVEVSRVRRIGEPEDVAELGCFLCSPWARHIQGVAISVDGGATSGVY